MNPRNVSNGEERSLHLAIPLETDPGSDVKGQEVKVVLQMADGTLMEQVVKLTGKGKDIATFDLQKNPGQVKVLLGPGSAPADSLGNMQTLTRMIQPSQWGGKNELQIAIRIPPYYLIWWPMWCRKFTITGKVQCPDGNPVPGATVSAYDIDGFWWWTSKQQVGSAVTDLDGTFSIDFTWCCGWWPWYWWNLRRWELDPVLSDKILNQLKQFKVKPPIPDPEPDPRFFDELLTDLGVGPRPPVLSRVTRAPVQDINEKVNEESGNMTVMAADVANEVQLNKATQLLDLANLDDIRSRLVEKLPAVEGVEMLHLWPWWPWQPWFDCNPDIIFEVTQPCEGATNVIFEENWWDTRWNIPTNLGVTLVANDKACCAFDNTDPVGDCIFLSHVCSGIDLNEIGGNLSAPALPASLWGYAYPNSSDRPFAGSVPIHGEFGDSSGADYYEVEYWNANKLPVAGWDALPLGTFAPPTRSYFGPGLFGEPGFSHPVPFPIQNIDGHNVIETRHHYEANHAPGSWGVVRGWYLSSVYHLGSWLTGSFADGLHTLRVKSYGINAAGHLINEKVLNQCYYTPATPNFLRLRIDNRVTGAASGHPWIWPAHPCNGDTVHTCTLEPETVILAIKILNHDGTLKATIGPCGNVDVDADDLVQFDFVAYDKDGHLHNYTLQATYADNLVKHIAYSTALNAGVGAVFVASPGPGAAAQQGPSYAAALADVPPATRPIWNGGAISIRARAADVFPITCSYQLELRAYKRTIVSCDHTMPHRNLSERSFSVRRV